MNTALSTPLYLVFNTTYHAVVVGLYRGAVCLGTAQEHKKDSSKNFLILVRDLLAAHAVTLRDCAFIGVQTGPGPFTTLRVTIASVNGLAFATKIPLVGVHGLDALLDEFEASRSSRVFSQSENVSRDAERARATIALLDAYCGDLYYGIRSATEQECGEVGVDTFANILAKDIVRDAPATTWIGNGVLLNYDKITTLRNAHIPDPLPEICSLESVAQHALAAWEAQQGITHQLIPLYMKNNSAILGKTV